MDLLEPGKLQPVATKSPNGDRRKFAHGSMKAYSQQFE